MNIKVDIHSHILPGLDDGAEELQESLVMLQKMESMGFETVYITPHIRSTIYPNTPDSILPILESTKHAAKAEGINLNIQVAAEYYIDTTFEEILQSGQPLLTFPGNYVLIEFSFSQEPLFLFEILFKLQTEGYKPILAHPERYLYFHHNMDIYTKLRHHGCLLQMNLLSFTGYYGADVRACAKILLKKKLVDFWGSDLHHPEQLELFQDKSLRKAIQSIEVKNNIFL